MNPSFHQWAGDRKLKVLVLLALLAWGVSSAVGAYISIKQDLDYYGGPSISVRGVGEMNVAPDVATFSFGVEAQAPDPAAAQQAAAEKINAALAYLAEQGVAAADTKTVAYNIYPRYEYPLPGPFFGSEQRIVGYIAEQTVQVKVREASMAGELIAGVGARGATNVSGLSFTIDDAEAVKAEAREKAVADAKEKAEQLADALGVRLVRITNLWEEEGGGLPPPLYEQRAYGGDASLDISAAPKLPAGENTITSAVNLTYEIR